MRYLNISEARAKLLSLVDAVAQEEVVITHRGKPVAKLVRYDKKPPAKNTYPLRGLPIQVADDFDEPLPGLWEALE